MKGRVESACRLCLKRRPLQNSHVLPEWGYESLYDDGKHRFLQLSATGTRRAKYMQQGLREPLLCKPCETQFSRYERYARNLLTRPGAMTLPRTTAAPPLEPAARSAAANRLLIPSTFPRLSRLQPPVRR